MHEHVFTRSPGLFENWPHLFDRDEMLALAETKLTELAMRGIRTIVDLTTVDLGRDVGLVLEAARRSPVQIVVATGAWKRPPIYFSVHGVDAVTELFVRDITVGIGTTGVKAGIIKCATDTDGVTPEIDTVLRAAARAHLATGVPISTHTWAPDRVGEIQQAIFTQEGVDLRRVVVGHSGDTEDLDYLRRLMDRGGTIGMDRFGLDRLLTTEGRIAVIVRLCAEGYADRMVLSHDANCWCDMVPEHVKPVRSPSWHFTHISDDVLPALRRAGVTDDQIELMLVGNPRRIFEGGAPG
jgi:phosphotriesterase-related protein